MNHTPTPATHAAPAHAHVTRIQSIDVLRGLTILLMIFVNDVASVKGLPWWTYHMPNGRNGMTYVDVVFPVFLFLVGVSIPLAVRRRLRQGDSFPRLWRHIAARSLSLVVLGLIIANSGKVDPNLTGIPGRVWGAFALTGAILLWLADPKDRPRTRLLRFVGLAILIVSLAIFRRATPSGPAWLDFRYWEILGLIGRAYLAACLLYVPLRDKRWAPGALLAVLTAWNVASKLGLPSLHRLVPYALWPFDSGSLPSIVLAGIVAHQIFFDERADSAFRAKALRAAGYALALFAGGWTFAFLGISKNTATPAWCLFSAGISVVALLGLYWIIDVRGWFRWFAFAQPAGSNPLLTYLLPFLFYYTLGRAYRAMTPNDGWAGVIRAIVFTACMLALSWALTNRRIRMQL